MKLDLQIDGQDAQVTIERRGDSLRATFAERDVEADSTWLGECSLLLTVGGRIHDIEIVPLSDDRVEVHVGPESFLVDYPGPESLARAARSGRDGGARVLSPMPGRVVTVLVAEGAEVEEGAGVVVVEAMKMENEIQSPAAGRVGRIHVAPGDVVEGGVVLVEID